MGLKQLLSVLLVTSFTFAAQAIECRNIDLRANGLLGSIRDQQGLGWCYAYVAADMYTMALGRRVSPFDIAINHYRDNHSYAPSRDEDRLTRWQGGNQHKVFESAKAHGVCPDNVFSGYMPNSASLLAELDNQLHVYQNITGQNRKDAMTRWLYPNYQRLYVLAPMTPAPKLRDMMTEMDLRELPLVGFADQLCDGKRIPLTGLRRNGLGLADMGRAADFIRASLQLGRVVGFGYNAGSLRTLDRSSGGMNHISSIVASRNVNGSCDYLLRNSWGPFAASRHHPLLRRWAEGDYVWFPEEVLLNIAQELDTISR